LLKDKEHGRQHKNDGAAVITDVACEEITVKKARTIDFTGITVNHDLDRFSGDEFIPERYKEHEIRLANSVLPSFE
jgi:hypothetical protein